jgi:hypothetical protein
VSVIQGHRTDPPNSARPQTVVAEMELGEREDGPARRTLLQRAEFVTAFTEHAGAKPASERLKASFPMLLTTTAAVIAAVVVAGIFWRLVKPPAATTPDPARAYVAVAGWGCTGTTDHGFEAVGRTRQWLTIESGGWTQDGCRGTFETIPMTGNAKVDDVKQFAQWWFQPAGAGQCRVQVYVPRGPAASDSAATDVSYSVLAGRDGAGYADFTVNQSQATGGWVDAGTFPVRASEFVVRINDRGVPRNAADRIAIAQLRAICGN